MTDIIVATVGSADSSGVSLIIPPSTSASEKRYKCLITGGSLSSGDMVLCAKIDGTYVVLGKAGTESGGGEEGGDEGGDEGDEGSGLPAGGATGQILVKASSADYDATWQYLEYSRPNLLDNWYFVGGGSQNGNGVFPINQRGQTQYSTAGEFIFDRWKLVSGTVTLTGSGLTLNGTIQQTIEAVVDQQYTVTMLTDSGIVSAPSSFDPSTKVFSITYNSNATIKAVKLELGSFQTLAHEENGVWVLNELPDYDVELLKAYKYLQIIAPCDSAVLTPIGFGYGSSSTQIRVNVPLFTSMVKSPSVTVRNCNFKFYQESLTSAITTYTAVAATAGSNHAQNRPYVMLLFTVTGAVKDKIAEAAFSNTSSANPGIILSAES